MIWEPGATSKRLPRAKWPLRSLGDSMAADLHNTMKSEPPGQLIKHHCELFHPVVTPFQAVQYLTP